MDLTKYRKLFLEDATEHLAEMSRSLLGLEKNASDANDNEETNWFPKSQVDYDEDEILMPRWLALDKGLGEPLREDA